MRELSTENKECIRNKGPSGAGCTWSTSPIGDMLRYKVTVPLPVDS